MRAVSTRGNLSPRGDKAEERKAQECYAGWLWHDLDQLCRPDWIEGASPVGAALV